MRHENHQVRFVQLVLQPTQRQGDDRVSQTFTSLAHKSPTTFPPDSRLTYSNLVEGNPQLPVN
eukprot:m.50327 g.50327  ORF g.50327 m.50327 type:complete len:63 (+) comp9006_c0_seq2:343-531(+)